MISDMTRLWEGSLEGTFTLEKGSITDEYRLDHSKLDETIVALLAGVAHSDYANLYVKNIRVSKLGDAAVGGGPNQDKLTISWETLSGGNGEPPPIIQNDMTAWVENWNATGDVVTIGEGFVWESDANSYLEPIKDEDISAVIIFPKASFSLTGKTDLFNSDAKTYVLNTQGKINKENLTINGFVYQSDHLLFESFSAQEGKDIFGNDIHTLTYNFEYLQDSTWNEYWRKDRLVLSVPDPGYNLVFRNAAVASDITYPYTAVLFSDIDPASW